MRKPEQTPEPSIEEILASIRKIIADDGTQGRVAAAAADIPRQALNKHPSVHSLDAARPARPEQQRLPQAPGPGPDDEILELTEESMLDEQAAQNAEAWEAEDFGAAGSGGLMPQSSAAIEDDSDERGLESVLSNVAAEVERLAAGDGGQGARSGFFQETRERAAPAASDRGDHASEQSAAVSMSESWAHGAPASQPPAPMPPSERPRMHSRQPWSARRLESGGAQPGGERRGAVAEPQSASPAHKVGTKSRDRWAEGVQMPVPETGPTMPFPYASEDEPTASYPAPADENDEVEAGEDYAQSEDEKSFVGDFLTRVFGGSTQQDQDDEIVQSAPGLKGKAEDLAKAAVADFASDKLAAPAVATALHADRPFMDEITDSLESALAKAQAMDDDAFEDEESVADRLAHDELPDVPPPPDEEFEPFDEAGEEVAATPAGETAPRAAPAGPTISDAAAAGLDLVAAHPDALFGGAALGREPHRSDPVPAAKAPARQDRSAVTAAVDTRVKPEAPVMSGNALPEGIEESIKEMIKPLIMQWLNDNLARIVEQAVREELADRHGDLADLRPRGGGQR
jgi:cell pole-organizing protein PopZ